MRPAAVPLRRLLRPREDPNHADLPVLSVYRDHGVIPKDSRTDNFNKTPEDLTRYLLVLPDDLVVNKMKAWSGSVAVSSLQGIVSGDYLVCSTSPAVAPRFLHHILRSRAFIGEMQTRSKGIRPSQERLYWDDLAEIRVRLPGLSDQRRIAAFLDDQVARIDDITAARARQIDLLDEARLDAAWRTLSGSELPSRRPSGLRWLETLPADWPMTTVHAAYEVLLGKMLDESRYTGRFAMPYLRNTNVQWDRITTDDLKLMDIEPHERSRFGLRAGDLLICEGGQSGRSAVWDGSVPEIAYQKALHRARPRGNNDVRWLQAYLRVAVALSVFSVDFGQATIGHLTGEQLRSLRLPMPRPDVQRERSDALDRELERLASGQRTLHESMARLDELKRSLIAAAVTGEFDVSSADGSRVSV